MNRLNDATSPYLLQHAGNPVDWWPWCDEAFAQARERDVPVLLSIGYSACHWCHVMAHESFEDPETATLLNENLVAIKVDREERPDVDAVYMAATQAMTGQGGWPMTVFMTPGREPFYCGTYFPREYFQRLVLGVARAWREDRGSVTGQAATIASALAQRAEPLRGQAPGADLAAVCDKAVLALAAGYDDRRGGFGRAPKFPPSMVLEFLLRHSERPGAGNGGDAAGTGAQALAMAVGTARAMARGGMYDQLGGGFARYSVDAGWVVPHFEKMLYDNALLARAYAHLWRRTGDPLARRVAHQTCTWMIRELRTAEGGFASALDADSEGEEGLFYTWTPAELEAELGAEDGRFAAETFGVTQAGTFEGGRSVLQLLADARDVERFAAVTEALSAARERRVRPGRDDKVVAAWNGLAIAALAECGLLLSEPGFVSAASDAAGLLARVHLRDQRLARTSRAGMAGPSATSARSSPASSACRPAARSRGLDDGARTVTACPRRRSSRARPSTWSLTSWGCDQANGVTRAMRSAIPAPSVVRPLHCRRPAQYGHAGLRKDLRQARECDDGVCEAAYGTHASVVRSAHDRLGRRRPAARRPGRGIPDARRGGAPGGRGGRARAPRARRRAAGRRDASR